MTDELKKDVYKFWSRRKLKAEIVNLKNGYNLLYGEAEKIKYEVVDLLKERDILYNKLSNERRKNRKLRKENKKLSEEHQKLYDCIQKWYEPIDNTKMAKLVEETKNIFESFLEVVEW
jgi:hypothetical protein